MTRRLLFVSGAAACAAAARDWEPLFDGESLKGWTSVRNGPLPRSSWCVEDGCIRSVVHRPTFEDIRTERTFLDFELEWEWRIAPRGNSGVKYLIDKYDAWTPPGAAAPHARARGLEYQLTDDASSEEAGRDRARGTASIYTIAAPDQPPIRPAGEFNQSKIVVRRPVVEHWLNGRRVVAIRLDTPEIKGPISRSGFAKGPSPIALQNHSSECWFRNLRIREIL